MAHQGGDRITVAFPGFVEIVLRGGWTGLVAVEDVEHVVPRDEGGSAVRIKNLRTLLVSVPAQQVIAALRKASKRNGGTNETAR